MVKRGESRRETTREEKGDQDQGARRNRDMGIRQWESENN